MVPSYRLCSSEQRTASQLNNNDKRCSQLLLETMVSQAEKGQQGMLMANLLEDVELLGGASQQLVELSGRVYLLANIGVPFAHDCLKGLLPLIVCALVIEHAGLQ